MYMELMKPSIVRYLSNLLFKYFSNVDIYIYDINLKFIINRSIKHIW
jgi:hypothetical protein